MGSTHKHGPGRGKSHSFHSQPPMQEKFRQNHGVLGMDEMGATAKPLTHPGISSVGAGYQVPVEKGRLYDSDDSVSKFRSTTNGRRKE